MLYKSLIICLVILLAGCTPEVTETSTKDAKSLVEGIQYVKASNGLCFGVASIAIISTNNVVSISQMITNVNCNEVNL